MGGEKYNSAEALANRQGSPPHGRGKGCSTCMISLQIGITPAWAGKSLLRRLQMLESEDHPRMGGEKAKKTVTIGSNLGSPPHGRGKV